MTTEQHVQCIIQSDRDTVSGMRCCYWYLKNVQWFEHPKWSFIYLHCISVVAVWLVAPVVTSTLHTFGHIQWGVHANHRWKIQIIILPVIQTQVVSSKEYIWSHGYLHQMIKWLPDGKPVFKCNIYPYWAITTAELHYNGVLRSQIGLHGFRYTFSAIWVKQPFKTFL